MLARSLSEPRYRDGLALALDPERLAEIQRELARKDALSRIDYFDRGVFEYECGKPLREPQNLAKFVTYARASLVEFLLPGERDAFERLVERIRFLGVEIP